MSSTVQYYYASPVSNPAGSQLTGSVVSALSTIIGLSGSTGALAKAAAPQIAANAGSNSAFASLLTGNASSTAPNQPKAYLNIIFFKACPAP